MFSFLKDEEIKKHLLFLEIGLYFLTWGCFSCTIKIYLFFWETYIELEISTRRKRTFSFLASHENRSVDLTLSHSVSSWQG